MSFAKACLDLVNRATPPSGPLNATIPHPVFIRHDVLVGIIEELATRLERACEALREVTLPAYQDSDVASLFETNRLVAAYVLKEIEALPDGTGK